MYKRGSKENYSRATHTEEQEPNSLPSAPLPPKKINQNHIKFFLFPMTLKNWEQGP